MAGFFFCADGLGSNLYTPDDTMPHMAKLTSTLWGAIDSIGKEDATADKIPPAAIARLIELKFVRLDKVGLPRLTAKGQRAYVAIDRRR